jgi:hypothetical protein
MSDRPGAITELFKLAHNDICQLERVDRLARLKKAKEVSDDER